MEQEQGYTNKNCLKPDWINPWTFGAWDINVFEENFNIPVFAILHTHTSLHKLKYSYISDVLHKRFFVWDNAKNVWF